MRDTAQVAIDRVGWAGRVAGPLLRLILLAGVAALAYLAFSLLDGPARADSRPAGPQRPPVVGNLLDGVGGAVSTVAGALSTPDGGKASDASATPDSAGVSDESRTSAANRASADKRAKADYPAGGEPAPGTTKRVERKSSDPSARMVPGNATDSARSAKAAEHRAAGERPAGVTRAALPLISGRADRHDAGEVAAGTLGAVTRAAIDSVDGLQVDALQVDAVQLLASVGPLRDTAAALDSVVGTVVRPVLDVAALRVADLVTLPPRLVAPVSTLPGVLLETIVATGQAVRDELVVAYASVVSRAPPTTSTPITLTPSTPVAAVAATGPAPGSAAPGRAAVHGVTEYSPGVPRQEIRPDGAGGSGGLPVRQPAAPESATSGHVRAGGEGSPDRPTVDGRSAWQPELAAGAVASPADTKRGGQSAEVDAPSG